MGAYEKSFFDGLLDAMLEYVEKHGASAGVSMSHKEYVDDDKLCGEQTFMDTV